MSAGHGHGHGHGHGEHDHGHGHGSGAPRRALALSLVLTLTFMGVELVVGWWSGSLALIADAGHMASDSGTLALSLFVAIVADRPRDRARTFGYRRAEVIGAFTNAVALLGVAGWIVFEAVQRIADPREIHGEGMLITAGVGLAVNVVAAWLLMASAEGNLNVRAALYHVMGDALGSVAALIAGAAILTTGWTQVDPLASLVIALLLTVGAVRLLRESGHVLMEGAPGDIDLPSIERTILDTPGVLEVHDLHVWSLTPTLPMLSAHVRIDPGCHGTAMARLVGQRLRAVHGIEHVTIQPEGEPPLVQVRMGRDG